LRDHLHQFLSNPWVTAAIAGIGYGSWAFFVNSEYLLQQALISGIGQGLYASIFTLVLTKISFKIYLLCGGQLKGFITAYAAAVGLMIIIPLTIHYFLKTPDIWQAILPGLAIGGLYIAIALKKFSYSPFKNSVL
jgi:hypothetical protein